MLKPNKAAEDVVKGLQPKPRPTKDWTPYRPTLSLREKKLNKQK